MTERASRVLLPRVLPAVLAGWVFAAAPAPQDAPPDPQAAAPLQDAEQDAAEGAGAEGGEEEPKKTKRERIAEKKKALRKAGRELVYAQMEIKIAGLKAEEDLESARVEVEGFARALEDAQRALRGYVAAEAPAATMEAELGVRKSAHRVTSAEQDLAGILRIYAEETEASAKGEIIRRHEVDVEHAKQELEIARLKAAKVLEHEVPAKRAELEWKVAKAEADLAKGKRAQRRTELSGQLDVLRKEDAEKELEREIAELRRDLEKLGVSEDEAAK